MHMNKYLKLNILSSNISFVLSTGGVFLMCRNQKIVYDTSNNCLRATQLNKIA